MFARKKKGWEHVGCGSNQAKAISRGVNLDIPVIFHGGCIGCLVSVTGENKKLSGIEYCTGCKYFGFNQALPDKSLDTMIEGSR